MVRIKTVASYLKQIEKEADSKDCVYRGQANNAEWLLRSGAERRIVNSEGRSWAKPLEEHIDDMHKESMVNYHDDLLVEARQKGFGRVDGRDLDDLELLAALQHFGAATSLLDFTKQALVALYFACQGESKQAGKVFIVPYRTIPSASGKEIIKDLLTNDKPTLWWPMLHGAAERRIMTQAGLFLINITEKHEDMQHVIISKEYKKKILDELDSTYQINADTLFMDLSGFAQNHATHIPLKAHKVYLYNGLNKFIQYQYKEAIEDFDKTIRLKPDYTAAYWGRGMAKYKLKQHEEAIKDFNDAIRLKPDDAAAYYARGLASKFGDNDKARSDLQHALKLAKEQGEQKLADKISVELNELDS